MVQRGAWQGNGDFFAPRENWGRNERPPLDIPQDGRFVQVVPASAPVTPVDHTKPLSVESALRDCARIPLKEFALVAILENGQPKVYRSSNLTPAAVRYFSNQLKQNFRHTIRPSAEGSYPSSAYSQDGMHGEVDIDSGHDARKHSSSGSSSSERSRRQYPRQARSDDSDDDGPTSAKRKRPRGSLYPLRYGGSNDDTPVPVPVQKTQQLVIENEAEVEKFYFVRFKDMQQSSCKVMGKAFVKLVEPKKQTHHPYTKGDEKAPPWWPNTTGEKAVRHKEPDHLLKPERIQLLVHILRMIVEPTENQCLTVQKLGLNIKKLEEVTMEAMSNWFNDKDHPENASKRPFLKEIFKVAKTEERYKRGEVDGSLRISVMYGEGASVDGSDDEVDEGIKDEDEDHDVPVSAGLSASESLVSPSLIQHQNLQQQSETDSNPMFHRTRLPVRYAPPPQMENQPSFNEPAYFPRSMSMNYQPQSPSINDPDRRPYGSPGYQSPPQSVYSWNSSMVTSGPPSFFATSPQSTLAPSTSPYQLPPPNNQQPMLPPPMMSHPYDGMPNGRQYDSGPALGHQPRTGSLGHPNHIHGFQEFLHENNGFGQNDSELKDDQPIHPLHPTHPS